MTCLVGLRSGNVTVVGADKQTTWGYVKESCTTKVRRLGSDDDPVLFASCGLAAVGHAIEHRFSMPSALEDEHRFFFITLPDRLRKLLKDAGLWDTKEDVVRGNGSFIIAWREYLAVSDSYLAFYPPGDYGYVATGSGREVAMGCLYATGFTRKPAEARVVMAVDAACEFSVGVGGGCETEVLRHG